MNVICYIDGFNLYHGLRTKGWRKYYWLDLWRLGERFLAPGQRLAGVTYCTTRVKQDPPAQARQSVYLDALTAHRPGVRLVFGHYLAKRMDCFACGHSYTRHEEKMTDVNIACHMLADAMDGRFDVALLVSGDSDLVPPVELIHNRWPGKRVVALFPPGRKSDALRRAVRGSKWIAEADLRASQLPPTVQGASGRALPKPREWA